jgi:hypothetical protein
MTSAEAAGLCDDKQPSSFQELGEVLAANSLGFWEAAREEEGAARLGLVKKTLSCWAPYQSFKLYLSPTRGTPKTRTGVH